MENQSGNLVSQSPKMDVIPLSNNRFFTTAYFISTGNCLQLAQYSDPIQLTVPRAIELPLTNMERFFRDGTVLTDLRDASSLPPPLAAYTRQLGCEAAAYVPILQKGQLRGFVLIGASKKQDLDEDVVNAFS